MIKKVLYVSSYNTTGLNGGDGVGTQRLNLLPAVWIPRELPSDTRH